METYLVRARGDAYYVAKVQAESPRDALERAELDAEDDVIAWFREDGDGCIDKLDDYEVITPSDTSVIFPSEPHDEIDAQVADIEAHQERYPDER